MSNENEKYCLKLEKCEYGSAEGKHPDLSYEEQFAGYCDVDGKKVYCKVFDWSDFPLTESSSKKPHNIPNIFRIIKIDSVAMHPNSTVTGTSYHPELYSRVGCTDNNQNLQLYHHWPDKKWENYTFRIVLYYTCTDR